MQSPFKKIATAVAEFFVLLFMALLPVVTVYTDVVVLGGTLTEISVTEILQETLLLLSAVFFCYGVWKKPAARGFLVLVAGFYGCMFIRETDELLDYIWHGFWVWPALLLAFGSIAYARFCVKGTTLQPMLSFINTKPYVFILIGLIILLVFSRTFGSGNLLWDDALPHGDSSLVKTVVQEGVELLGYTFVFYGSLIFQWRKHVSFITEKTN